MNKKKTILNRGYMKEFIPANGGPMRIPIPWKHKVQPKELASFSTPRRSTTIMDNWAIVPPDKDPYATQTRANSQNLLAYEQENIMITCRPIIVVKINLKKRVYRYIHILCIALASVKFTCF